MISTEDDAGKTFKEVFKFYKKKNSDLTKVYDFSRSGSCRENSHLQGKVKRKLLEVDSETDWDSLYGMKQPKDWEIYKFSLRPGLLYIKNPFTACGQRYWIARCLKDFTKKPNHLNIDAHNILKGSDDWWEFCMREIDTNQGKSVLQKLRWATLGYHHNWDTKEYSEEMRNEFPNDLKILCKDIASILGFQGFSAEAAIINMYHYDSCLSGHTDHSEIDLDAPLFSFSFGQSAIFLIGGRTLDEEPLPLLLESGDILVMSEGARLCYHGIPKILSCRKKTWTIEGDERKKEISNIYFENELLVKINDDVFWEPFESYISKSRINMNVRQVLLAGQTNLS